MATIEARDVYIPLRDTPGDARRVQMILAEWGLDEATIQRMLGERKIETDCCEDGVRGNRINPAVERSPLVH